MRNLLPKRRIHLGILRRWFFNSILKMVGWGGYHRTSDSVKEYYDNLWGANHKGLGERFNAVISCELNGRPMRCRRIDIKKMRIVYLSRSIRELNFEKDGGIKSILELGSGSGFNILALAALHPEIKTWVGIDLAPQAAVAANFFRLNLPLKELRYVTELDENIIRERLLKSDIRFCEGDMLNLAFSDNSFDAVFSCQAIEQLNNDYPRVFQEAKRVVTKGAFFLEEFAEAQDIFQWMHLKNIGYFCASYREVKKVGFNILKLETFPISYSHLSLGLLVCVA